MRRLLNLYLRLTERRFLARAEDPEAIRASFEKKARLYFHAPFGTKQSEIELAGRPALDVTCGPAGDTVLLYFHGGAYVFGSPRTHAAMLARLCQYAKARAILPDYRKAPEHRHPAAIEDALACYLALLAQGTAPAQVIVGGDSAGGGLALALLAELLRLGHPVPAGCFAFSPLTDQSYSGESVRSNAAREVVLPAERTEELSELFLGDQDRRDPRASPLFAEFKGAPPVWLTVGDTEILRDDSRRMAERLRDDGVEVVFEEKHDLPHVWPIFQNLFPPARATLRDLADWIAVTRQASRQSES